MPSIQPPGSPAQPIDVAIVGAGVIGVACATLFTQRGLRVQVFDPQPPGMGASYGNASHLATEQVLPIAEASILKRVPAMLLDPLGPLRLDWRYLPQALPWFARLLLNLRPGPYANSVAGIRALNERSLGAWQRLLASIGQAPLLRQQGSVLMYERAASLPALHALMARLQAQQVAVEPWSAAQLREAAPALAEHLLGGLFFPATGHFIDPHQVVQALWQAAERGGARFAQAKVSGAQLNPSGVLLSTAEGATLQARKLLLACGAHSRALTEQLTGVRVPLDTERGYHLMLPHEAGRLPFAATSFERKFIMTPLQGGLRLAGTVEFAGLRRPPNLQRAWNLQRLSQGLFTRELNSEGATPWMGFRPSLPDSLPVLDQACGGKVLLAFGHQHLGLTQAAATAEIIASIEANGPGPELARYRLGRF
ncbi:FAD-dependent oxidoreductase [Pseudomonas sp. NPDC007930]|uniref:NAD(P)/FAD-dependent oxidoreductase n=1 Tax=Pseudomonas sp. NPDC007930 TaxID=3364417 RepID=UPI0036EA5CB2